MKERKILTAAMVFLVLSLACTCLSSGLVRTLTSDETPTVATAVVEATPPSTETPTEAVGETPESPSQGACFADMPIYPGAERDQEREADVDDLIDQLGALGQGSGETRVYATADSPADVVAFYRERMSEQGWEKTLDRVSGESGIVTWEKEGVSAQLFVGTDQGETLILLGCGEE